MALSGIGAPIIFTMMAILLSLVRPGFDQISQPLSELGRVGTPYAVVWDATFMVTGVLTVAFAYGLHKGIANGKGSKIGPILVGYFGAFGTASGGVFPLPSPVHDPSGLVGFLVMMVGLFVISRSLGKDPAWQGYRVYSIATGLIAVTFLACAFVVPSWFGGWERLFVGSFYLWILVMSIHMLRLASRSAIPR